MKSGVMSGGEMRGVMRGGEMRGVMRCEKRNKEAFTLYILVRLLERFGIWNDLEFGTYLYIILYVILTQVGFVLSLLLEPICIL